jgi:hypothetical protein
MTQQISPERKKRLVASAPEQPPPAIPRGGHAAHTPYPDYDVVAPDKWRLDWDEPTRQLVLERVLNVPSYRFFTAEEAACLEAVCDRLFPQEDRPPELRIPIAPWIDDRLHRDEGDGYRYAGMPSDQEAYRRGLRGIQETAELLFDQPFDALRGAQQDEVLWRISAGSPPGVMWETLPVDRFFGLLVDDAITEYYAHPTAWAEIGFSGPSSPRGHIRLAPGMRDPWEAEETGERSSVEIVRRALEISAMGKAV